MQILLLKREHILRKFYEIYTFQVDLVTVYTNFSCCKFGNIISVL